MTEACIAGRVDRLASTMVLGTLLEELREQCGGFRLLAHWQQGEFHHDVVLQLPLGRSPLGGLVVVVGTNCNGGVKEVMACPVAPNRQGLWRQRCPENMEFNGPLPTILACSRTNHWFDPCELLEDDARSELRPEFRRRQHGGGWEPSVD